MDNSENIVNDVSNMSNNNQNDNREKNKNVIIALLLIVIAILIFLLLYFTLGKKDNNVDTNVIVNEVRTVSNAKVLYVNGKQVEEIKADSESGDIKVEEFKDVLIVDETNPGLSRRLFIVDKNGNATELDYKVSTYNEELISFIDSYRIEGNNLYIKVNRQWGNGYIDWYCRYNDKDEIAEYEVKYEYSKGKFNEKQVINEMSIKDKYKDEDCSNVE